MCALCSNDPKERKTEMRRCGEVAARLRHIAAYYDRLSYGKVIPHSEAAMEIRGTISGVIRDLVEEWV